MIPGRLASIETTIWRARWIRSRKRHGPARARLATSRRPWAPRLDPRDAWRVDWLRAREWLTGVKPGAAKVQSGQTGHAPIPDPRLDWLFKTLPGGAPPTTAQTIPAFLSRLDAADRAGLDVRLIDRASRFATPLPVALQAGMRNGGERVWDIPALDVRRQQGDQLVVHIRAARPHDGATGAHVPAAAAGSGQQLTTMSICSNQGA
jgi:hypothetical protein